MSTLWFTFNILKFIHTKINYFSYLKNLIHRIIGWHAMKIQRWMNKSLFLTLSFDVSILEVRLRFVCSHLNENEPRSSDHIRAELTAIHHQVTFIPGEKIRKTKRSIKLSTYRFDMLLPEWSKKKRWKGESLGGTDGTWCFLEFLGIGSEDVVDSNDWILVASSYQVWYSEKLEIRINRNMETGNFYS